jgi:hypothetical protein
MACVLCETLLPPAGRGKGGCPAAATGWRRAAEIAYVVIAVLFILSVFVQFFLAGLGVFGAESFEAHHVVNALIIYTAAYHVLQRSIRSVRTATS